MRASLAEFSKLSKLPDCNALCYSDFSNKISCALSRPAPRLGKQTLAPIPYRTAETRDPRPTGGRAWSNHGRIKYLQAESLVDARHSRLERMLAKHPLRRSIRARYGIANYQIGYRQN